MECCQASRAALTGPSRSGVEGDLGHLACRSLAALEAHAAGGRQGDPDHLGAEHGRVAVPADGAPQWGSGDEDLGESVMATALASGPGPNLRNTLQRTKSSTIAGAQHQDQTRSTQPGVRRSQERNGGDRGLVDALQSMNNDSFDGP